MKKSLLASLIVLPLILTGCSTDPLAEQYLEGSNKNYIAGDGTITEIPVSNRSEPVVFRGEIENGDIVTSQQYLGNVLVVNFWYAGCAPCRAEARDLEQVYKDTSPEGVNFLGVNVRDQAATALAFSETFGVTYPSIIDQDGQTQMAFSSNVPPNAVPTTVVLDAQGRVAARILGQLTNPSILETLIQDISAESTP